MAKENRRFSIKGVLDIDEGTIIEHDKDLGDIVHKIDDILLRFNGQEDITWLRDYSWLINKYKIYPIN